ncbi:MAG: hypothetical protein M4D80_31840 [Myxococcota bacterium]|nr:hypothetical protein [Myxococcota bacterium]
MAESRAPETDEPPSKKREEGAPIPKGELDPDLIKLQRARPKIGIITSAGMVFLCAFFIWRLTADRKFGGEGDTPRLAQLADVMAGKVAAESFIELPAEPMMSHAIRSAKGKGDPGLRTVPVRGTNERVWLVLDGVGWDDPVVTNRYPGRLRELSDLPFGAAVRAHATSNPRPVFATSAAVRGGLSSGTLKSVDGDDLKIRDTDRIAFDVVDPNLSTIIATFTPGTPEHAALLDAGAWQKALDALGITAKPVAQDDKDKVLGQVRFDTQQPVTEVTTKLEGAKLWSARVEPVTRHLETTWGALKGSSPSGFTVGTTTIPDQQLDLLGIYVTRAIPSDAYALIVNEVPQDYWYILPITIVVGVIGLLFLYALIRTVNRDFRPTRA